MATLRRESRSIPTTVGPAIGGDELYLGTSTGEPGPLLQHDGDDQSVEAGERHTAYPDIIVDRQRYTFVMWNVAAVDGTAFDDFTADDRTLAFTKAPTHDVVATAWYYPVGPDGDGGPPAVVTLGFDRTVNRVFRAPPIEAVTPAAAWAGGAQRVVATTGPVTIDATDAIELAHLEKVSIAMHRDAVFERWRMPGATSAGDLLSLEAGRSGLAIAVYHQRTAARQIFTIPYWMWKALHGVVDQEVRDHLRPGPIEEPGWGQPFAIDALRPALERAQPQALRELVAGLDQVRERAQELAGYAHKLLKR